MEKIILTGGGTAGHIMPNIALLPYLSDFEIHYVGQPNSMEEELIKKEKNVTFHAIESVKLVRSLKPKNLLIPFKLFNAVNKAKKLLKEISPAVIFSKGGFVSLPISLASPKDLPLILHESDFTMGLANKMIVKKCKYACCSFADLANSLKNGVHTGAPLRQSLYCADKKIAERECRLMGRKNLLIFGGSLGADYINNIVFNSINELTLNYDVVHITGKNNIKKDIRAYRYFQLPFSDHIADYFAWADLVVTRGGANALFELASLKKPSLVIPLPKSVSRGDQLDNADYFVKKGFFHKLSQEALSTDTLIKSLKLLDNERATLINNMHSAQNIDGTLKIANLIHDAVKNS